MAGVHNTAMNTLVVAAHPDDEVLGCGGTIAALSADSNLRIGILGEGVSARYPNRELAPPEALEGLKTEARAAAEILGVSSVVFGEFPDNRFDTVPLLDIVKTVEGWIADFRPEAIYTHHPGDLNIDHTLTFRAVLTATRPTADNWEIREVLAFETASATEWAFQSIAPAFRPNTFVDVTETIEQKVRALQAYQSEVRPFPHPRSPEALRATAQRWGSVIGAQYAEAFELIRSVRRVR